MAKPVSEEELQLKKRARRRLIGAIALVAGVAAVLPMVLDSEPKSGPQDISIQIPSPEPKGAVVGKVVPLAPRSADKATPLKSDGKTTDAATAEKSDAKPAEKPAAEKTEAKAPEKAAVEKPEAKPPAPAAKTETANPAIAKAPDNPNDTALSRAPKAVPEKVAEKAPPKAPEKVAEKVTEKAPAKATEKAAEKPPVKTAAPKAGPGAFFIQVIALSEAEKAKQVQQQIAGSGVRAYTEVVTSGGGQVTRVRAGPFATREEAERAQAKLQGIGLEGKVAAY